MEEREAAAIADAAMGLDQLGEGIVYTLNRGLPAPNAVPRYARQPIMEELPRRVNGMHPMEAYHAGMCQGLYNYSHEDVLPKQVPARHVHVLKAASALRKIKMGIEYCIKRVTNVQKKKKSI